MVPKSENTAPTGQYDSASLQAALEKWIIPSISEDRIQQIVKDINRDGIAQVSDFFPEVIVQGMREFIENKVEENGNEYIGMIGRSAVEGTALQKLSNSKEFNSLLRRIYELGMNKKVPDQNIYQVVRCLTGESGLAHNFYFHYDTYIVTALVPIVIPTEGQTGDLIINMNRRKFRPSYLANLVDKIILQNTFMQNTLKNQAIARSNGFKSVKIQPGNIYFFWGYQTCHANEPCEINKLRSTALFHFGDPYTDSRIRKFTGRAEARAETNAQN